MIHRTVLEWRSLSYSDDLRGLMPFPAEMADRLVAVARRASLGGEMGRRILHHGRTAIRAGQVVRRAHRPRLYAGDPTEDRRSRRPVRTRRAATRARAYAGGGTRPEVDAGTFTDLGVQNENVLEVLIRLFCNKLFVAVHRGLPRRYIQHQADLPTLRGRLDVLRQFTVLAASPQRLACRYDALSSDIALNRIMKAAVARLTGLRPSA